ncbi:hypothetical protein GCM10025868_09980 [Angustibacter aerolatus]|uniref:Isoleucine--tRNA ligase n=1 Tax=Angustibacter aerolatus TaxID=1162965 RepID=A0ABQ6JC43_9ACTN|nr:hypothetical protein GCM10025868_09980 [Angustibacter aerolatus]
MIWTTTPWTLPSNLAAAVNPDVDYVVVTGPAEGPFAGERLVLAAERVGRYERELGLTSVADAEEQGRLVQRLKGTDLLGRRYTPPFDFFVGRENAHRVLAADYVTTDDGTGIVHIAPAFGEEDKVVTDAAGIEPVVPVDSKGEFTAEVPPYAGMHVFEANSVIARDLRERGCCCGSRAYEHPYPHCWRCGEPLIYKAVSSLVRAGHEDQGPHGRASTATSPGCPTTSRTARSASGCRTRATGRSAATATGAARSRCGRATTPRTRGSTCTARSTRLERDFGVRPDDLHRPYVDEPDPPEPRRPDRPLDDAPGARGARLLVRVGVDAVRPGALPVREPRVVRAPLPG